MQQTFSVNENPRILIEHVNGDLRVSAWDSRSISISIDGQVDELYQEGETLVIHGCEDSLVLQVPHDAEIRASHVDGDVLIQQVRRVELSDCNGDVVLERIGQGVDIELIGEAVALANIEGDLVVRDSSSLRAREAIQGDASISNVALIEIERIESDVSLQHPETAVIGTIGGDLSATDIEDALTCGNVGGDCSISGNGRGECTLGNVGSDLSITGITKVHVGSVGGDCIVRDALAGIEIGNTGGDASFHNVAESIMLGNIGGDASMKAILCAIEAGNIGGDLALEAAFPPGSATRLHVGGDAALRLPSPSDLTISAFVGGDIVGISTASGSGNQVNVVYGSGSAQLELYVGGDLAVRGGGQPSNSSSYGGGRGNPGNRSDWQSGFERDMAELGREMGKLGQEIGREITDAFKDASWQKGSEWANAFTSKMEEQVHRAQRKAEEQARKSQERAQKAQEQAARMRVRFNDREWQIDPERLERLKEQATRAANEGISGALDAVERAIQNLRVPPPPRPPTPPRPPVPPVQPVPQYPPVPPMPQSPADATSAPARPSNTNADTGEPTIQQEREAILRMIAEGRISPEEGDMLLEGLGG